MAIMTVRQAAELDHALDRNGWTAEDVKNVSGGDILASLLLVVRGLANVVRKSILTFLYKVKIGAQPTLTTSEQWFQEAGVALELMGQDFRAQFLGLEVPAVGDAELVVRKLEQDSLDVHIMAELGDKAEISVSQFRAFLAAHRESPEWFLFYLKGKDGKFWAVSARWSFDYSGWHVEARSVQRSYGWAAGGRVPSQG
jgi:hypothetical protein